MASVSEEILLEVKFTDDNTAKRMAEIQNAIAELNEEYAKTKKAVKENGAVTADQAKAMAENKAEVKALTNEMKFYEKQLQAEAKQAKITADSVNGMRTNLSKMIAQYDALSKADRDSEVGQNLRNQINQTTDAIKEAEFSTQRYQRNVGNYANAMREALSGSVPAVGKFSNALVGLKTSAGWIGLAIQALVALFAGLSKAFNRTEGNSDKMKGSLGKLKGLFIALQKAVEPLTKSIVGGLTSAIDGAIEALGWLGEKIQKLLRAVGLDGLADKMENFAETARESAKASEELAVAEEKLTRKQRDARKIMLEYSDE